MASFAYGVLPAALCFLAVCCGSDNFGLRFYGQGDHAAWDGVDLQDVSFSFESWVRVDSFPQAPHSMWLFMHGGPCSYHQCLFFGFRHDGSVVFGFVLNDLNHGTFLQDKAQWVHWAGTYDVSTKVRVLYRNGEVIARDVAAERYQPKSRVMHLGQDFLGSNRFSGCVDEFRVWRGIVLTQDIIQRYMRRRSLENHAFYTKLATLLHLDEGAGQQTFDSHDAAAPLAITLRNMDPEFSWVPGFARNPEEEEGEASRDTSSLRSSGAYSINIEPNSKGELLRVRSDSAADSAHMFREADPGGTAAGPDAEAEAEAERKKRRRAQLSAARSVVALIAVVSLGVFVWSILGCVRRPKHKLPVYIE